MDGVLILVTGKSPLAEVRGGDLNYVRMWGRAAMAAGYSPQIVCAGRKASVVETAFGRVHTVRSPMFWVRDREGVGFRGNTIPFHRGVLARKVLELAREAKNGCVVHAFGSWNPVVITAGRRIRREGLSCRCVVTFWTTVGHEVGAKSQGLSGVRPRLSARLLQGWEEVMRRGFQERWEREAYQGCDRVLVNYESVRKILADEYGAREGVRRVTYTSEIAFLEKEAPRERVDSSSGGGSTPLLVSVSRHDSRKGVDVLIRALAILRDRGVAFRAVLAGYGNLHATHRELVASLGLADRVSVPGYVEDVFVCLREADVFVLPSLEEGSGSLALLQAMEAGCAVVASDVDGIPEDVADRDSGLLVRPGDAEALADGLAEMIGNAELRGRLGGRAREVFEERFSREAVVAVVGEIYGELFSAEGGN